MKRQRAFVAINLPDEIKSELASYREKWSYLPARWTKEDNFHITLSFLGDLSKEQIQEVIRRLQKTAKKFKPREIKLARICLSPAHRQPAMVWVEVQADPIFSHYEIQRPHITLARKLKGRPEINQPIDLSFWANSIELMASHLYPTGAEYAILSSIKLSNVRGPTSHIKLL